MERNKVEVNKNGKNEQGQYPTLWTEQVSTLKDLLYGQEAELTFAEQKREIPENRKKDSLLLAFSRTQPFKPFNKHAYWVVF